MPGHIRSSTQWFFTLSVGEAESAPAVMVTQDMPLIYRLLGSIALSVKLLVQLDNKSVLELARKWTVGG